MFPNLHRSAREILAILVKPFPGYPAWTWYGRIAERHARGLSAPRPGNVLRFDDAHYRIAACDKNSAGRTRTYASTLENKGGDNSPGSTQGSIPEISPDLQAVVKAWPALSGRVKAAILALLNVGSI